MKLKTILRILTTPSCWQRNHRTDHNWDRTLNALLDQHEFTNIDRHTARLGGKLIWIANHPYDSFTPYSHEAGSPPILPSRETAFRAYDKLKEAIVRGYNDHP